MMYRTIQDIARPRFGWIVIAALTLTTTACQSPTTDMGAPYETVPKEGYHDTESARKHLAQGLKAMEDGDYDRAELAFRKALEADVMSGPAHNNLGKVYYQQTLLYKAAWEFKYAIKLMPNQPEPKNNLGLVYEAVGKLDDAINLYGEAREIEPDNPVLIGNLTRARFKRGDKDDTTRELLRELVLKDTRPEWLAWARETLALMNVSEQQ